MYPYVSASTVAPAGLRGASTALTCDPQAMWLREELGKAGAGSADEEAWLRWCTRTVRTSNVLKGFCEPRPCARVRGAGVVASCCARVSL